MSVSATNLRSVSLAGGGTAFTFNFEILSYLELGVYVIDTSGVSTKKTYSSDYTVSGGILNPSGGTVTFGSAPTSGYMVLIQRESNQLQPDVFGTGQAVPSQAYEQALDRLTLLVQELSRKITNPLTIGTFTTDVSGNATIDLRTTYATIQFLLTIPNNPTGIAINSPALGEVLITGGSALTTYSYLASGV
jgi:hypothetical protein